MLQNRYDFSIISKALTGVQQMAENDQNVINQRNQAKEQYYAALSHITAIDPQFFRYGKDEIKQQSF